jgi:hypothetical protein
MRLTRSLGIVAGAAICVLALGAGAGAAPHGTDRPFQGSATGIAQFGGAGNHDGLTNAKECDLGAGLDLPDEVVEFLQVTTYSSSDGNASLLGKVHVETAHCPSPFGPRSGQMAIVAANGDVLFGEYEGEYAEDGSGDPTYVTFVAQTTQDQCYLLNDVPCRSTGRFADVSGTVTMRVWAAPTDEDPFVPWSFATSWTGESLAY